MAENNAQFLGIQTNPILPRDFRYHRGGQNAFMTKVNTSFAEAMGFEPDEVALVHSPLLREVLARENPNSLKEVNSKAQLESLIDQMLEDTKQGIPPPEKVLLDFSTLLKDNPQDIQEPQEVTTIIQTKVSAFRKKNPTVKLEDIRKIMLSFHLIAFTRFKGQDVILMPKINYGSGAWNIKSDVDYAIVYSGFALSPDQLKEAWLKLKSPEEILTELDLPTALLATQGLTYPTVCQNFNEFLSQGVVKKFKSLSSDPKAPPYVKVLPEAACLLLEGLADKGIDKTFTDKGIGSLLQTSYFRMLNAMNEAILRKNDLIRFNNQIELIHQEIQSILAICQPYDANALANAEIEKLSAGPKPVIPNNLERPLVHLKPSAMHCYTSAIAGVEALKKEETGSPQLNIVVQKSTYYESVYVTKRAKTHPLWVLDGEQFSQDDIKKAFDGKVPDKPIDVFVCEFHHNISVDKSAYRPEEIIKQIKAMHKENMLADKCTILLDTTLDLEKSDDVRTLLHDSEINGMIQAGKLNVVLFRSAQKFDMLGMDNYYGGITTTINKNSAFETYNNRANLAEDQLEGLSYQGLAHLQASGGSSGDKYRQAAMANTQRLYQKLPKNAIYEEGTTNPLQISKIDDQRLTFLDIKTPGLPTLGDAIQNRLAKMAFDERLPLTQRASFGFVTTNLVTISHDNQNKLARLSLGLEGEATLNRYADFFTAVRDAIEKVLKAAPPGKSVQELELAMVFAINSLDISNI